MEFIVLNNEVFVNQELHFWLVQLSSLRILQNPFALLIVRYYTASLYFRRHDLHIWLYSNGTA